MLPFCPANPNALHTRADAASALVVVVGIGGALLGWSFLDLLAAALMGFMILRMGGELAWGAIKELIDTGLDEAQVEGAENLQATQALIAQAQAAGKDAVAATEFVRAMQLNNISLWCSNEDAPIVLDYRIDAQGSDQILAVKCDAQGQITDINWES